jgi:hypothetical protein
MECMCGLWETSTPRICAISEISNVEELSKLPLNLGNLVVGGCKKCHVINMNWDHSYPTTCQWTTADSATG